MDLLIKALAFAAEKHRDQRRRDGSQAPYINHPIAVAQTLSSLAGVSDESILCAALLHDVVEDTPTTLEDIEQMFGAEVAALVAEVTDPPEVSRAIRKQRQIDRAAQMSHSGSLIKLADQLCNVADLLEGRPSDWDADRTVDYINWAEKVVAAHASSCPVLTEQFTDVVKNVRQQYLSQPSE